MMVAKAALWCAGAWTSARRNQARSIRVNQALRWTRREE